MYIAQRVLEEQDHHDTPRSLRPHTGTAIHVSLAPASVARFICPRISTNAPNCTPTIPSDQQDVRRAQNLHIEPVGVVPPVVERRRSDHGDAAPRRDERPQRPAEAPYLHGCAAQRRSRRQSSWKESDSRRTNPPERRTCKSRCAPASRTCPGRSTGARKYPNACPPWPK